jgi:hypothetical protein
MPDLNANQANETIKSENGEQNLKTKPGKLSKKKEWIKELSKIRYMDM